MSDAPNAYWQSLLDRKHELDEKASTQSLSQQEQAELLSEYESVLDKLRPYMEANLERMAFHFQLMEWQGTIEPGFKALYDKKAAIDEKFFRPNAP